MVKTIINSTAAFSLILGLIGCTPINRGIINSYVEVGCDPGSIKQVAVFSMRNAHIGSSRSQRINKEIFNSISPQINKTIINAITSKNPEITIISPSAALRKINASGLASEWVYFVNYYYNSGIINKDILYKVSNSLGVDAVLLGQLLSVNKGVGNGGDTTKVTVIFSILEASTAMTIWEVSADGIAKREMDMAAPPVREAIDLAVNKVTEKVPRF